MFCSVSTEKANYLVYSVITLSYVCVCEKVFPAPLGAFDMLCLLVALYRSPISALNVLDSVYV